MTLQQSKNTLSENVKKHRTAVSMSTEALSNICGVNQRTIQDIESGVANPQFETIYKIADTLGIPLFELLIPQSTAGDIANRKELLQNIDQNIANLHAKQRNEMKKAGIAY